MDKKNATKSINLLEQTALLLAPSSTVLDLACGKGRNGLALQAQGFQVHYIDRDQQALDHIGQLAPNSEIICADLESDLPYQLTKLAFDAILVFRYLHRPLMPQIIAALKPGGYIVYQTFNHQQATIGRPKNPNFLLNDNELLDIFKDFAVIHFFEGFCEIEQAYIAQIIAKKPE